MVPCFYGFPVFGFHFIKMLSKGTMIHIFSDLLALEFFHNQNIIRLITSDNLVQFCKTKMYYQAMPHSTGVSNIKEKLVKSQKRGEGVW